MSPPWIGVTGPARGGHSGWGFTWLALRQLGARVRRIRPPYRSEQLRGLHGVVIGGGAHVEPSRYAAQPSIEYVYDEQRDEFEWNVLAAVMDQGIPVLGICRGAQLINVFLGGTLYQNLPEDIPGLHLRRHVLARKRVEIAEGSLLMRVMGVREVRVNSLHEQGVRDLGHGLRVSAFDSDGVVQAIEAQPGASQQSGPPQPTFVLGVQWHPEYLITHAPHRRLFLELIRSSLIARAR